jgi:D-alanyl-D-alanine carboxypeptidase
MDSTDKIMVALVALEQVKRGEASLDDEAYF